MKDALEDLEQTIESTTTRLLAISEEESERRVTPDTWCAKEIIGHLIDSASSNHQRFVRAQFTDDLVFPGYDQAAWVSAQKYRNESWQGLIQLWRSYNLHIRHLVANMPEEAWKKLRPSHNLDVIAWKAVSVDEPVTLEYFIRDYIDHLKHHLNQLFARVSSPKAMNS